MASEKFYEEYQRSLVFESFNEHLLQGKNIVQLDRKGWIEASPEETPIIEDILVTIK